MKNEVTFLRGIISGGGFQQNTPYMSSQNAPRKPLNKSDKVKDSITDIYSNMPD